MKAPRYNLLVSLLLLLSVAFAPMTGAVAAIDMMQLQQGEPCHMLENNGEHIASNGNCCDEAQTCQDSCGHCFHSISVFGPVVQAVIRDDLQSNYHAIVSALVTEQPAASLLRPPQTLS